MPVYRKRFFYCFILCVLSAMVSIGQPAWAIQSCAANLFTGEMSRQALYKQLSAISSVNLKRYEEQYQQYKISKALKRLLVKMKKFPPYIIQRRNHQYLCRFLESGKVLPLGDLHTPVIENHLFSAYHCVFTSYSTRTGVPKYGDSNILFKPIVKQLAWATRFPGAHYMKLYRFASPALKYHFIDKQLSSGARYYFKTFIFTAQDWYDYLRDRFVLGYFNQSHVIQEKILHTLLALHTRKAFQAQLARFSKRYHLGYYLEMKSNAIPLADVEQIIIPVKYKKQIQACPAYATWRSIITFKK